MTKAREEQIIKASQLYAKHLQKPFMDGAMWADAHPNLYSVTRKAVEREREHLISKACEWLNNFYNEETHSYLIKEDIDAFRKAMEEQE